MHIAMAGAQHQRLFQMNVVAVLRRPELAVQRFAVVGRLRPIAHTVLSNDAGDAQAVVGENPVPAVLLCLAVLGNVSPCLNGVLVAPERQRQDLLFSGLTRL